ATRHSPLATRHSIIPICYSPEEVVPIKPLTTQPNLLFLGGMHWPPNAEGIRWFVEEIWPRVRAQRPEARLLVVGKSPPSEIAGVEGVSAPGYVDDVVPFWWDSRFFIVPLRAGGGMRVKIIDAWARGLPVVSTTIGAEGIAYRDGQDILIADAPAAFADAIIRVLKNDTLAQKLAKAGRRTVMEKYNWKSIYQAWDEIYP
ncbi:MAG: glycosyltransferase family 4 protein, partial [Chloroflexi bacterium]|nr:glycosyltransferase family 4 protein [Chloroflexota bacterium]